MKEKLAANSVSPTLFVGCGGIGSRIIKRLASLTINDNRENMRFVVLDTDVNDLSKFDDGVKIEAIQTSSTRSVEAYLKDNEDARENWFPVNHILETKSVSEGAGQVRAISRLALEAIIRNGKINTLYEQIDELFLKDGKAKAQAIRVVLVSTSTGGTGSGISMILGMMIRSYINKTYPESAAIIRGFVILPGVMDCVVKSETERESQRRNGYATIKEINAFMMKASGFCDSVAELKRYKNLHIMLPTTNNEFERLEGLPYDFCFLFDSTDQNNRRMSSLKQYEEYVARSIYEQNIGPMKASASSKEDNVLKEFIDPKKYGRCRFGSAGAAVLRYPYDEIVDYLALGYTQKTLFGFSPDDDLTDEEKIELVKTSWSRYDTIYAEKRKEWEKNGSRAKDEPILSQVYCSEIENYDASGDEFTLKLVNRYLVDKANDVINSGEVLASAPFSKKMAAVANNYLNNIIKTIIDSRILTRYEDTDEEGKATSSLIKTRDKALRKAGKDEFEERLSAIEKLKKVNADPILLRDTAKTFARDLFRSTTSMSDEDKQAFTLTSYLSSNNKVMHPNAVRYLIYKLINAAAVVLAETSDDEGAYNKNVNKCLVFDDKGHRLEDYCAKCDKSGKEDDMSECNKLLKRYADTVIGRYTNIVRLTVAQEIERELTAIAYQYEKFYASFERKAVYIEKARRDIAEALQYRNGDCIINLFGSKDYLAILEDQHKVTGAGADTDNELFARIFDCIKANAEISRKAKFDKYSTKSERDVFSEVITSVFRNIVERNYGSELDVDILSAIRMEYMAKCELDKRGRTEEEIENINSLSKDTHSIAQYIEKRMNAANELASPGILKSDGGEAREVTACAYNHLLKDVPGGIRVSDFLDEKNASAAVSKYELRFFRSVYDVMPTQIAKFMAFDDEGKAGDYFRCYCDYMGQIGPDSKSNAVITPHIDKRWNSISVMPELDIDYQRVLMKNIHQAMFYGFAYNLIERVVPSKLKPEKMIYRFNGGRRVGYKKLIVSNGTACDFLYEVLDSLYFDRAVVTAIHKKVEEEDEKDEERRIPFEETTFYKNITNIRRKRLLQDKLIPLDDVNRQTSIFEIPVLYFNSLPPQLVDDSEIEIMIESIMDAVLEKIKNFTDEEDTLPTFENFIKDQYKLFAVNYYELNKEILRGDTELEYNDVISCIRRTIEEVFEDNEIDELIPSIDEIYNAQAAE